MIETIAIAIWSYMFTGPWSDEGKVFGWLKSLIHKRLRALYMPLIGCATCHAVWAALLWQLVTNDFSFIQVVSASFLALLLDDFHTIRERWKNN